MWFSIRQFAPSLLSIVVLSLLLLPPAQATNWVGNDDGEFDVSSNPTYVGLFESFGGNMQWSSSPPNNIVSMQYNPDLWTSFWFQYFAHWFQTVIWSDQNGCGGFSIQVYSTTSGSLIWRADQGFNTCSTAFLANGATWFIREDMVSSTDRRINDVFFSIGSGSTTSSFTLYPSPNHWVWERSNLCWCGTDRGSTTFTTAWGTSNAYSNVNVNAISPPVTVSTAENSNMPYDGFQGSGTTTMWQHFGWVPPPPPPGHCGFCPCAPSSSAGAASVNSPTKTVEPYCT